MKGFSQSISASIVLGAAVARAALPPITVNGNAFFAGNERFYIRGVDYQPGGAAGADTVSGTADPLADSVTCKRDIAHFKDLGLNTIRVYTVDNTANHDECMQALDDAGIYLVVDVNTPQYSLNREDPHTSYNDVYLQSVFATMDAFAKYDNTMAFFSGNEVINNEKSTKCAPYIKAVVRDMKSYRSAQGMRGIPIGYSAADVSQNREQTATYLNCGSEDERSDLFAFNDYSWCDPSTFDASWKSKVDFFKDYSLPLFMSEYGCIETTRHFQEVATLYSSQMTPVYSGGLVYEYSEEGTGYGLTTISGNTVKPKPDYAALKEALQKTPAPSGDGGYHTGNKPSQCPPKTGQWDVSSDLLPAIPEPAIKYMKDGAGKGPGLKGDGSQTAGTPSTGLAKQGSGSGTAAGQETGNADGAGNSLRVGSAALGLVALASALLL